MIIRKLFFVWGEEKEKAFLEEMAKKGYKLIDVGLGKYVFKEIEPEDLVYQFDFKGIKQDDTEEYKQLYEDAGWEIIAEYGSWYYFCKKRSNDGKDVLFSDNSSKLQMLKRLLMFLGLTGFPLYYQALIMIPAMRAMGDLGTFYTILNVIIYPLVILHGYAVIRILLRYRKLSDSINE